MLTYGLSNNERGNKRKDSKGFHDGDGEGREGKGEGAAAKERLSFFVLL